MEKRKLEEAITKLDKRLEEIEASMASHFSMTDEEFIAKASAFLVQQELSGKRFVNFEKLAKTVDLKILKEFAISVITKIVVKDGRILLIRFKNGLEHRFLYRA